MDGYIYIYIIYLLTWHRHSILQTIPNDLNNSPPAYKGLIGHTEEEGIGIIPSYIYVLTEGKQNN